MPVADTHSLQVLLGPLILITLPMSKYLCCLYLASEETEAALDEDTRPRVTAIEKQMWD